MLEIPEPVVEREMHWYQEISIAKTSSRSVLGSLNEIASYYQTIPERLREQTRLSLSEAELELSKLLHSPLNYRCPVEVRFSCRMILSMSRYDSSHRSRAES